MKEPEILVVPETNTVVKDKNILYSDEILQTENYLNRIMIKEVSGICIYSLERCLKIILESNPDAIFYNIQYSKNKETVYFYTNKEISTDSYINRKKYKSVDTKAELLEEIKNTILTEKNKDNDCISLYEVASLLKTKNNEYEKLKENYGEKFSKFAKEKYCSSSYIRVYDFDYENNELKIGIRDYEYSSFNKDIVFSKAEGDLYLKKEKSYLSHDTSQEILVYLGNKLSKLYDEFIEYSEFKQQISSGIISTNNNCYVEISKYGVEINFKSFISFSSLLKLCSYSYTDEYGYKCNSNNIICSIKGNEDQLLKKIYVEIGDCPKWSRPFLYEIRQKQLVEELKIERLRLEEERIRLECERIKEKKAKIREEKRQKRLELRNKIFPFLKK